eukprot:EG_transcript_21508
MSSIDTYIKNLGNVKRYDSAFRTLVGQLLHKGVPLQDCTVHKMAEAILDLAVHSLNTARNAYAAVLLLPGFGSLRFSPLLSPLKRKWNSNVCKYAHFWDPTDFLENIIRKSKPLSDLSVKELRNRLIICWRLLALHRGVDLARTQRKISFVGEKIFILLQRKGWQFSRWEEVLILPHTPLISPWHLLKEYVERTAHMVGHKNNLLWSLDGKRPLTSERVNSLTKEILQEGGVDTTHWKPHSTRGAGVLWWKNAGLQVEEVQQLGQWKNFGAFQAHYLRLGVVSKIQTIMAQRGVHSTSPSRSA